METKDEQRVLLTKLRLLSNVMKRHEWSFFRQEEAEEEEATEQKIDFETSASVQDTPQY